MAIKRKRASFSPTIIVDSEKESEDAGQKPVLQQVVELVMEEPKEKEQVISPDQQSQDNIEDLRERIKKELKQELKEELSRELRETLLDQLEHKIQNRMQYQNYQERYFVSNQDEYSDSTDQKENIVPSEEENSHPQKSVQPLENKEEQSWRSEEKRKETVAELFGKSSDGVMPEITIHEQRRTRGFLLWAITMIAIAIGVGGGLVLFTNFSQRTDQQSFIPVVSNKSITPTITPKPSPTPSPTVSVNKKDIKIQVQNGAGVVGAASKMKSFLEKKGYTVVDVGNASTYSYEETEILVKSSKLAIRDMLEEDLSEGYTLGRIETTLPEAAPYDVRVIVGKK